jgi:GT2 family glycosyltransferase
VSYNSAGWLLPCLESVDDQTYPNWEVILVDNASKDSSLEQITALAHLKIIRNQENRGFAAAQNQAISVAKGRYFLALNPDVVMSPKFLETLVNHMEGSNDVGWACGKLLSLDQEGNPHNKIYATGHVLPRNRFTRLRGRGEMDKGQYDAMNYVFGAPGAAAIYKSEMIRDLSYEGQFFDETFFTWGEDVDVDWRAQLLGWQCLYVPEAVAYHAGHDYASYPEPFRSWRAAITIRNRWLTVAANEKLSSFCHNIIPLLEYELSSLLFVIRTGLLGAYLQALFDFFKLLPYVVEKRRWIQSRAVGSSNTQV